jgi:hypothetical protein
VPDRPLTEIEVSGIKSWVEKDCAYCHNVQGQGGRRGQGPDLANVLAKQRSKDWIISSIRDPLSVSRWNIMPKYDHTEEELQGLLAYIQSLDFARYGLKTIPREAVLQDKKRSRYSLTSKEIPAKLLYIKRNAVSTQQRPES